MNCPKCQTPIGDKDLVCPKCKKVLRLKCPVCGAITKNTVCEKCGAVTINKCYKCGKLNSTAFEKCPKCGMDINASIGLRESVIEEFAVLTIEITNLEDIKNAFKSDKIVEQFKKNLYTLIKKTAARKKLRVQILEDTFIIRFCKDYSFVESCSSAIDFSIYVAQTITEINQKLFEAKGIEIKAQMAVQKRDVYSKPSEYKSGININVVYSSNDKAHLFHNTEVVADSYVYQATKLKYPYQSLSAIYVKNQMVMFFELILHQIIKLEKEKQPDINSVKLPQNVDYEPEEEPDEKQLINFSSLNCTFLRAKADTLLNEFEKIHSQNITNPIISIRSADRLGKLSMIETEDIHKIFSEYNVVRFSCPKENKYNPYGLFKQLILAYRNIDETNLLLHPELVDAVSQDTNIQALFKMEPPSKVHPEDLRYNYFEAFTNFIRGIPYKTIFVIDDMENTDEGSLEIIKYLCENNGLGNIGFIVSCADEYSLHRKIYKLMTSSNYFEIELKSSSNKAIVTKNIDRIKQIQDSFFYEKVLENTKGSYFYFNEALKYLVDDSVLEQKDGSYKVLHDKMIVIPKDINELVQKRISHLKRCADNTFELYASLLLMGEKHQFANIHELNIKDDIKILKYLESHNFIKIIEDKDILITNYNLYRTNLIECTDKEELADLSNWLLENVYIKTTVPDNVKAQILEFAKLKKEAFAQWHSIAMISSQIGDFCAYLNCTNKFLSLVDNVIDEETDRTVEQVKMEVYAELASLLYKYYPDKILNFLQMLLTNLESRQEDQKIKEVANKLVQSCLISGNYNNALEYIGKIISRTPAGSFNPNNKDFNLNYYLVNLVTLEIYFNLGRLNECIELGEELFKYIDIKTINQAILPEGFSKKQFDDAILDALFFICAAKVIQLSPDRREYIMRLEQKTPQHYTCFKLLVLLSDFFAGQNIIEPLKNLAQQGLNDKYSTILFPILQGLVAWKYQDWNNLGNYIYNAKLQSAALHLHQMEYFCDLMIGFAYQNLGNSKKAKQIFYNILDLSEQKGLKNITYLSWIFIAKAEADDNNIDMSAGIVNNSILNMENDTNISDYFVIMFKLLSSEIMLRTQGANTNIEQALFCAEQAFDNAYKKGLYIYLQQIADMLAFLYNGIITNNSDAQIKEIFKHKIEHISRIIAQCSEIQGQA